MRNHKKKIDSRARRLQKARGEGQEWHNAREERARARGARAQGWGHDAGRVGAGGCSRRGGRQRQRGEDNDGESPQRGDPTAVPPRGVEPRTLPTIRPTGRPGQRLFSSSREPSHLLGRRRACRFSPVICSLPALQHAWQREVGRDVVHGACEADGAEGADATCAKNRESCHF